MNSDQPPEHIGRTHPMWKAAIAYCIVTAIAILLLRQLQTPLEAFGAPDRLTFLLGRDPLVGAGLGLSIGAALAVSSELFTRYTRWGRAILRILKQLVGGLHPGDALLLAALSALGEELLFRGILLPYLGLWGSSALFGLAHFIPRKHFWVWALWAAGAGLVFGWAAQFTGGLLAPALAHFGVNAVGLLTLNKKRQPKWREAG